jgi:NTE family protein
MTDEARWTPAANTGLVLPGGGARGAYQVGVLKGMAEILPPRSSNPFCVVSGTSAGAINSTVLASRAAHFNEAVAELEYVWGNFQSSQVFRSDALTMLKSSLHWAAAVVFGGLGVRNPKSLLDNAPLRELLQSRIDLDGIGQSIDQGCLDALAITAASYGSARSVSFFQGKPGLDAWRRVRRIGRPARISYDHLMASIAVPLIFPPIKIGRAYFGDGAMRQATPLSPALRLGAERLLVVGVRNEEWDPDPEPGVPVAYPSFGRIAGYMLDALFMDGLSADLERLTRINLVLSQVPDRRLAGRGGELRFVDALIILPSEDIRDIAIRHSGELPRPVRLLMRGLGNPGTQTNSLNWAMQMQCRVVRKSLPSWRGSRFKVRQGLAAGRT